VRITILGGVGELGSMVAALSVRRGYEVRVVDRVRPHEAWRLDVLDIKQDIEYVWKDVRDILPSDIAGDYLFDCACQPDRDFGIVSPTSTVLDNLEVPLRVLEAARDVPELKLVMYPSSTVEFSGFIGTINETSTPVPTNHYGLSKWMAEELYRLYDRVYGVKTLVIRTGSCYYPMMRTTQFISNCIVHMLKGEDFYVKSPDAARLYTYGGDVQSFYQKLFDRIEADDPLPYVLHNGGNYGDEVIKTIRAANLIKALTGSDASLISGGYETGEQVGGVPVNVVEESEVTRLWLGWSPQYTFEEGLRETIFWFKDNLWRYM